MKLLFFFLTFSALTFPAMAAEAKDGCPVTAQPNPPFVPPAPYWPTAPQGKFWYGSNALWTWLRVESTWPKGGEKLFLWQQGFEVRAEPKPDILVIARRLDIEVPLVISRGGTNAIIRDVAGMLTGVAIPTAGCWEINAHHAGHDLSFVVSVLP
jgi:hypothetical protein